MSDPMHQARIQKLEDMLLISVPPELDDSEVMALRRIILRELRRNTCRWVLLDFTLVEVCDSFFGRFIHGVVETARMLGAEVVICSLQDPVIETLVEMGFTFPKVHAVLDLDDALAFTRERASSEEEDLEALLADAAKDEPDPVKLDDHRQSDGAATRRWVP